VGLVCTGSLFIGQKAGLLDGYPSDRFIGRQSLCESYEMNFCSKTELSLITFCSGLEIVILVVAARAAMDMMVCSLIGKQHGMSLAVIYLKQFVCERIRTHERPTKNSLQARIGTGQPKLVEAVQLNGGEHSGTTVVWRHLLTCWGCSRPSLQNRLFKGNFRHSAHLVTI